jgi:hypothetical protein
MSVCGVHGLGSAKQPRFHLGRQTETIVGNPHFGDFVGARDHDIEAAQRSAGTCHGIGVVHEIEENPKDIVVVRQYQDRLVGFQVHREAVRAERASEFTDELYRSLSGRAMAASCRLLPSAPRGGMSAAGES